MLSAVSLYVFLLFIMFHPIEGIDTFLEVKRNTRNTFTQLLLSTVVFLSFNHYQEHDFMEMCIKVFLLIIT